MHKVTSSKEKKDTYIQNWSPPPSALACDPE